MKGGMHKLWKKASAKTHSVPASYKNRPVKEMIGPPRPAKLAERIEGKWTIMHTGPQQEFVAVAALRKDGYAAYCPAITRWVRRGRTRSIRHVPLFPRYIFVGVKPTAARSLNACAWAKPLSLDRGSVPFIGGGLVYALSDMQAAGAYDEAKAEAISEAERTRIAKRACEHFRAGDQIVVTTDVWEGFHATIAHAGDDERVIALVNLFGRATKVHLTLDQFKAVA